MFLSASLPKFWLQVNAMPFEMLARSLPYKHIKKSIGNIHISEALMFGQAGMLSGEFTEEYPLALQKGISTSCK
jgi:hypothetical protein